jgi:hypothetical protein
MHSEAWRQMLAGKGRETGSETEASKQASRGKWTTEAGKQKQADRQTQAKIDILRER